MPKSKEWRLVSIQVDHLTEEWEYRGVPDRVIPYLEVELQDVGVAPISEVVIGPKNLTSASTISALLAKHGFSDVAIR